MAVIDSLKGTVPFSFAVPLFSLVVTHCHSLSLFVTRCTTRCHSLSLVVIRCHSYHLLSLVVPLVATRFHSLSLDVPLACIFINDHSFVINDVYKNLKQNVNIKVKSKHKVVFHTLYWKNWTINSSSFFRMMNEKDFKFDAVTRFQAY